MDWFYSNISSREAVNLLLKNGKEGSFLVRKSESNRQNYTLVVRRGEIVHHITILNSGDYYTTEELDQQFSSLAELVQYLRKVPLNDVQNVPLILSEPLSEKVVTKEKWYHGNLSGAKAKRMLLQCEEDGYFLIRQSQHSPGCFALSVLQNRKVTHYNITCSSDSNFQVQGSSLKFNSLSNLVKHFQHHSQTTNKGDVIQLRKSLNTTRFLLSDIENRMSQLEEMAAVKYDSHSKEGYADEFEQLQRIEAVELDNESKNSVGTRLENKKKNRFKNILPFDSTRVKLIDDPDGNDYINANYIQTDNKFLSKKYIATQGPLKHTISDFWRMICQENVRVIAMTTKEVEKGKNKCVRYWPTSEEDNLDCEVHNGVISISFVSEITHTDYSLREFQLTQWIDSEKNADEFIQFGEPRQIFHFHYTGWPDQGVPDLIRIFSYILDINKYHLKFGGYLLVHCSAGIGRTGTIIIIDMLINEINTKGSKCSIDIYETVKSVRQQRSGMVQTDSQYKFLYKAIDHYMKEFMLNSTSQVNREMEDGIYNNEYEESY